MSWVILALTLGASITSIIHGVFMLFGSLSVNSGALFEVSETILACLPVVSAIFALIGGIVAFNRSKWGALFIFIAAGLCVPSKDTWLYGGIYFFAMLLCFFIKREKHDEYDDLFFDEEEQPDNMEQSHAPQYYFGNESENYEQEENEIDYLQGGYPEPKTELDTLINAPVLDAGLTAPAVNIVNNEAPKLRRRMLKTCPTCGATVSRDARFCSTCGTTLLVPAEELIEAQNAEPAINEVNEINIGGTVSAPFETGTEINFAVKNTDTNLNLNDGDDMSAQTAKLFVKPRKDYQDFDSSRQRTGSSIDAAASSYQEFSKYTRRAKKRKRSTGRKFLSMLFLVAAVGGALYFLLGLRKLPPGDLPPVARTAVINANRNENNIAQTSGQNSQNSQPSQSAIAVQEDIAVPGRNLAENILPDFTPEREPKSGIVVGSNVNVRTDHSTSSNRVTRLSVNSKIDIIGTYNVTSGQYQGIWYNVITGGKEGWIYGRYVQPTGSGLPSGYSNVLLKTFGSNKTQLLDTLGQLLPSFEDRDFLLLLFFQIDRH